MILGAVVRGVDNGASHEENDAFIQALMDHQEKLHFSIGRRRKRASIGVHDLSTLAPPFRVITVPESYTFVPLAMTERMSIREILEEHPKGVDYAHLLEGFTEFPVIVDAADRVLSFPPIINGDHTTVTESTTDFFIDVTGWDARACEASLLLVCLAFAARGGTVKRPSNSPIAMVPFNALRMAEHADSVCPSGLKKFLAKNSPRLKSTRPSIEWEGDSSRCEL